LKFRNKAALHSQEPAPLPPLLVGAVWSLWTRLNVISLLFSGKQADAVTPTV